MKAPAIDQDPSARQSAAGIRTILFVDSEIAVVDALRRSLFRMRDTWDMFFTSSYAEATACLESREFDVVVSDIAAHSGGGLDFIREVSTRWPKVIRIALTGDVEDDTAMEALGYTHQFLTKPAGIETITTAVNRATRLQALLGEQRVEAVIGSLERVPSLPDTYRRLTEVLDDPDSGLVDAAVVIEMDPGLASGILRVVNSAYFGLNRNISSIIEALTFIGVETLKGIVLQDKLFKSLALDPSCTETVSELIGHGIECGSYARTLAAKLGLPADTQGNLYMTGLTHEFGKLVMLAAFGEAYVEFLKATDDDTDQCQQELERFGADHAAIAAYLFGIWGFPERIVDLIARQHRKDAWDAAESVEEAVMYAAFARFDVAGAEDEQATVFPYASDNEFLRQVAKAQTALA